MTDVTTWLRAIADRPYRCGPLFVRTLAALCAQLYEALTREDGQAPLPHMDVCSGCGALLAAEEFQEKYDD